MLQFYILYIFEQLYVKLCLKSFVVTLTDSGLNRMRYEFTNWYKPGFIRCYNL